MQKLGASFIFIDRRNVCSGTVKQSKTKNKFDHTKGDSGRR